MTGVFVNCCLEVRQPRGERLCLARVDCTEGTQKSYTEQHALDDVVHWQTTNNKCSTCCSNVQMFKCSNVQVFNMFKCSTCSCSCVLAPTQTLQHETASPRVEHAVQPDHLQSIQQVQTTLQSMARNPSDRVERAVQPGLLDLLHPDLIEVRVLQVLQVRRHLRPERRPGNRPSCRCQARSKIHPGGAST